MQQNIYKPKGIVRVCKNDVCIEGDGINGELLVAGAVFFFVCLGVAALASAK